MVPDFQPLAVVRDNCAGPGQVVIYQDPSPGNVVTQGTYLFTMTAIDPAGNSSTNRAVYTVGPVLSITSPQHYASFPAGTSTPVTAQIASNVTDVILQVDFYLDDVLVGSDSTAPYRAHLTNVAAGAYSLTAEAVNLDGLRSRSESVAISFEAVRIEFGQSTNRFILAWPPGWTLQSAAEVSGPWEDVPATSPYTVNVELERNRFFRLRQY